jgi:hypothetical protein
MAAYVPFDEFRLVLRVPVDLDKAACDTIRRSLESRPFRVGLRRVLRQFLRRYPELTLVRVQISG